MVHMMVLVVLFVPVFMAVLVGMTVLMLLPMSAVTFALRCKFLLPVGSEFFQQDGELLLFLFCKGNQQIGGIAACG